MDRLGNAIFYPSADCSSHIDAGLLGRSISLTSCGWTVRNRIVLDRECRLGSSGALDEDPLSITERVVIALFVLLVGATGLVGLATPIMDWDAQHYHIPRVLYWVQNGSIEHYATANPRQLFMGPWPAFVQLHTYLLAGSDRLANMVQWACMVGSLILAGAIARQLGGRRAAGLTAVALVATLPMGIMQASTALTDYVTAFWVLVLMFLGLQTLSMVRISKLDQLALGGALGFAVLTKGTAVPIVAPFVIAWVGVRLRRRLDGTWQAVTVALLAALIVNATHFARNLEVFGHITGPEEHRRLVLNESYDPKLILSNLVRHPLVHIGTDDPDQAGLQLAVSNFVHRIIGVTDGDPRNSHLGQALHIAPLRRVDFLAGNPAHLMLYLTCGLWLIVTRFRHANARLLLYSACLLAAAVMFVAMFKYQHTISRLHLPIFVVAAPWCAVIMAGYWSQRVVLTITLLFLSMSVPWVVPAG
jgi:4-amino-4-deoxy-L-arabinose transferase-like glycosyltransferase